MIIFWLSVSRRQLTEHLLACEQAIGWLWLATQTGLNSSVRKLTF